MRTCIEKFKFGYLNNNYGVEKGCGSYHPRIVKFGMNAYRI